MMAYETACQREIERLDGSVIRTVGDGILCGFGHPRAHEDDAERAIWAGLKVVEAVGRLATPNGTRLRVRVGIATGLVVVTELTDDSSGRTSDVVGTAPILAVRLQEIVPPDGIALADSTRRLVGNVFTLDDLGKHQVKGMAEPVRVWRVLGRGDFGRRFEAFSLDREVAPLVGRNEEIGLLVSRCEEAARGKGQVVLLSGEPGIGKSRTLHALRDRLSDQGHRFIYCYCSPYHQNTAFYPLIALFERTYQLSQDDPPKQRRDAFDAMVQGAGQEGAATALLRRADGRARRVHAANAEPAARARADLRSPAHPASRAGRRRAGRAGVRERTLGRSKQHRDPAPSGRANPGSPHRVDYHFQAGPGVLVARFPASAGADPEPAHTQAM